MTVSIVDAESVLAIDLGSIYTRAILFDVVEGRYSFIASGTSSSTFNAPFHDVREGVDHAIRRLQEISGRVILNKNAGLILPTQPDGSGVDRLVVTYSAGPELKMVAAGLLDNVSLESAQRLAAITYGSIVESIGLGDRRRPEAQVDAILRGTPDLIILAGGSDYGANRSVFKLVDLIGMVCRLLPQDKRPEVLYAGNRALAKRIKEIIEKWTPIHTAPNVRPTIDIEDIGPAQDALNEVVTSLRYRTIGGLEQLGKISSTTPLPAAYAFGRMVRFLSRVYDPAKGVLGVDIGASSTTLAAAVRGRLFLNVFAYGMGKSIKALLTNENLKRIARWLPVEIPDSVVRDYMHQKTLYPASIPMTSEALAIEQAVARVILENALRESVSQWTDFPPSFEPVMAAGAILTRAPTPLHSLMMLLDGLQPIGVTTLILDQNHLTASMGAVAKVNGILPVQVMESGSYTNLGTVICPFSRASAGTPILRVRLVTDDGNENRLEVRKGSLVALPLPIGQTARIHLQALRGAVIDPLEKRSLTSFKVQGGICGIVFDARDRPITLPSDPVRRREMITRWMAALNV